MTRPKIETEFQEAVRQAIADKHAVGLPAYQGIDGYLVAIYPGGRHVRLKKLTTEFLEQDAREETATNNSRRPQRRR